jgi:glucose uptake protein
VYQPEQYTVVLLLMFCSMICWGSWANAMKLCPKFPFQLFYWDYTIGLLIGALLWGLTLGSRGTSGLPFLLDLKHSQLEAILWAAGGGAIFNLANLLLVAAIDIAGMAVAFPIGIGLALLLGSLGGYLVSPVGNPYLLTFGVLLITTAIVCDALAYKAKETASSATSRRGIVISLLAGALMGSFYPFVSRAMQGPRAPAPYAITFIFVCGALFSNVPFNLLLMKTPINKTAPLSMKEYFHAKPSWHLYGVVGGVIWATGAVLNFLSSRAHAVGPAIAYSLGQGATMISALWGVFVWREFAHAPPKSKVYLVLMFLLFALGLGCLAVAPLLAK